MDYIAASFVRTAEGVREIREYAAEVVREKFGPEHPIPLIVSKIESQEALDNWDEILDESDAIMVARGDLGVEVTLQPAAAAVHTHADPCPCARYFPPRPAVYTRRPSIYHPRCRCRPSRSGRRRSSRTATRRASL